MRNIINCQKNTNALIHCLEWLKFTALAMASPGEDLVGMKNGAASLNKFDDFS